MRAGDAKELCGRRADGSELEHDNAGGVMSATANRKEDGL